MRLVFFWAAFFLSGACVPTFCLGETAAPIVLGQSCPLSGPAKDLGIEFRGGLLAAISKINDEGGIRGRKLRLLVRDDGYEPDRALRNTQQFIEDDQVFMLVGQVGTPTAKAVMPLVEKNQIPFFAPFTGAEFLRKPFRQYVINLRVSYAEEMERLAQYLIEEKQLRRIACFYQNDSYGFDGLRGIEAALERRGMQLVSEGSYARNTVAVLGAMAEIYQGKPEAVVLVGTYAACAEFIKLSKVRETSDLLFCTISFVGAESLREALGGYGENVIVSETVPRPSDESRAVIREYQQAMAAYQHDVPRSFTSLEGYLAGKLFALIARRTPAPLARKTFVRTMEQLGQCDLGGIMLSFGPEDHQGMETVTLIRIFPDIQDIDE